MANHISAETRNRRNKRRADIAGARRSRVRTFVKKVESAIEAKDKTLAVETFKTAESEMMAAVRKNIFHINTAARKISRLAHKIKALV